jgi:hypothetical protein
MSIPKVKWSSLEALSSRKNVTKKEAGGESPEVDMAQLGMDKSAFREAQPK